jgi:signal transduction histidine kinase
VSTTIEAARTVEHQVRSEGPIQPPREISGGLFETGRLATHSHPFLTDALVALVLLGFSTLWLVNSPFAGRNGVLVQSALIVPLIWRRAHPTGVFLFTSGVALAQLFLGYQLIGDVALLVALYTVAVHESRVRVALASVVLEVGAILAAVHWEPAGTVTRSFLFLSATVIAALFAGLTVASGSRYLLWLAERAERLEVERDQQATIAATGERTRIAREMHDIVSHSLSVVVTLADAASVVGRTDPARAAEAMQQVSDVGRDALRDMRAMIGVLRTEESATDLMPQPGMAQLDSLVDRIRATGLMVDFVVEGPMVALGGSTELTVYRVVQEALTNSLKHATASRARVALRFSPTLVEVRVDDDGVSFTPSPQAGHGIEGMRERVALHGGTLLAGPGLDGGWTVTATLPISPVTVPA